MKKLQISKYWGLYFAFDVKSWVIGFQYWPCNKNTGGIFIFCLCPFAVGIGYIVN